MIRRPPRSTRTDTLFPYTTLFRSAPAATDQTIIHVTDNGVQCPLDLARLRATITEAGLNLPHNIDAEAILKETVKNIYDGIPVDEVFKSAILSARAMVENDPSSRSVERRTGNEGLSACRSRWGRTL